MTFGAKVKQYRTQLNITQKELADQMNVTFQTVSKWEGDINEPDFASVRKLAQIFGCTIDDLLADGNETLQTEGIESVDEATSANEAVSAEELTQSDGTTQGDGSVQDVELVPQMEVKVIDTCRDCRTSIKEGELIHHVERTTSNGVKEIVSICHKCFKKREEEMTRRAREIENSLKPQPAKDERGFFYRITGRKDRKPLIWAIVLGVVATIVGVVFSVMQHETLGLGLSIALPFLSGYSVMAVVYCIFAGTYVSDVFAWVASWSIKFPGLIWSFSLEGFMWLVGMKILFAIVGALFGIAVFFLAVILATALSVVSFIPVLIYNEKHYDN